MQAELTNLISIDRRKAFRRDYFIHLATVAVVLLIGVMIAQCVFLLPSYIYAHQAVSARTLELSRLSTNLATTQERQVQAGIKSIQSESQYLLGASMAPTASAVLRAILAVSRPGITLTGFTYSASSNPSSAARTLQVSGISDTREDLRSYDAALGSLPFVTSADLPISDYAQASAIPFTITLTGSLLP